MINARAFADEADLYAIQAAIAHWWHIGDETHYCHVGDVPHRLYNGSRGLYTPEETVRLWHQGDEIIGVVMAFPRMDGFDAVVHPAHRGGEMEREMLHWGYTTTRVMMNLIGESQTPVMSDVLTTDEIRRQLLLEQGYTAGDAYLAYTERSLSDPIGEVILPEGFVIRPAAGEHEAEQLAAVHSGAFDSDWTPELYRDTVMRKPGYEAEREIVVVAPDGRFAAFCIYWLDEVNKVGMFEPVGTHADFQRMGLARAMMNQTIHIMKARGMQRALVGHELDNPASSKLYESLGFKLKYQVFEYSKNPSN